MNARYVRSGCCDRDCSTVEKHCQPNAGALATCYALADNGTEGCGLCAQGTCQVDTFMAGVVTTVWDWLKQLNAHGFGGYHDWRLAKESGFNPGDNELETILLMPWPCTTDPLPCIDPIFGPTQPDLHWSATTKGPTGPTRPSDACSSTSCTATMATSASGARSTCGPCASPSSPRRGRAPAARRSPPARVAHAGCSRDAAACSRLSLS